MRCLNLAPTWQQTPVLISVRDLGIFCPSSAEQEEHVALKQHLHIPILPHDRRSSQAPAAQERMHSSPSPPPGWDILINSLIDIQRQMEAPAVCFSLPSSRE